MVPDDIQLLHPSLECCRLHIKKCGGSSRATHFPFSGVKDGKDMLTLGLFEGSDGMVLLVTAHFIRSSRRFNSGAARAARLVASFSIRAS